MFDEETITKAIHNAYELIRLRVPKSLYFPSPYALYREFNKCWMSFEKSLCTKLSNVLVEISLGTMLLTFLICTVSFFHTISLIIQWAATSLFPPTMVFAALIIVSLCIAILKINQDLFGRFIITVILIHAIVIAPVIFWRLELRSSPVFALIYLLGLFSTGIRYWDM
jgi:hypothetical protein